MSKEENPSFVWVQKTNAYVLYSQAYDPWVGFFMTAVGAVRFSKREQAYRWNQGLLTRNFSEDVLEEVRKKLVSLNK